MHRHTITRFESLRSQAWFWALSFVVIIILGRYFLALSPYAPVAQTGSSSVTQPVSYIRADVVHISNGATTSYGSIIYHVRIKLLDGPDSGHETTIPYSIGVRDMKARRLPVGSEILVTQAAGTSQTYSYFDRYRLANGGLLIVGMLVLILIIGRLRGLTSMIGLGTNVAVLGYYVIPRIIAGADAFTTCMIGAVIIATTSIFIAHGLSRRTLIAFISSMSTLLLIIGLATLSVSAIGLNGISGDEGEAIQSATRAISLSGLLLGGIVIASLGVLDDITTGQAAAVDELYKANPKLSRSQLIRGGMSVGREHIAALVNTLALAYVGVALPTIVVIALYAQQPLLIVLNSEQFMEIVVRTAIASIGLLVAVPITTTLAAWALPAWYEKTQPTRS